jgi:hypothetical protein
MESYRRLEIEEPEPSPEPEETGEEEPGIVQEKA